MVVKLHKVPFKVDELQVRMWCERNCMGKYYFGWDWHDAVSIGTGRIVEFTDERDAVLFTLVWA